MVLFEFELINIGSVIPGKIFSKVVPHNPVDIRNLISICMLRPR
ncbi:MAG: hypothetical protein NTV31_12285 [Bacteroidia bacterium]|nr:hypothetical protein [Bacteroidia bacterium]